MISIELELTLEQMGSLQNLLSLGGAVNKEVLPNTSQAFYNAGKHVYNTWSNYLSGQGQLDGLDPIEKPIAPKDNGLEITQPGDFDVSVSTDSDRVKKLQQGDNPVYFDMKQTHPYGRKSRVTKSGPNKGVPYLIIPFRWGTPNGHETKRRWSNFIPQKEYDSNVSALQLSETVFEKVYYEKNFKGEDILRAGYNWARHGGRLTEETAWTPNAVGMVRMKDVTKSNYWTFRIISAKSPMGSWLYWRDGHNPIDMLSALERTCNKYVEGVIDEGLRADLGISTTS